MPTSSTPAFLQAVHPALAIFQVGYRNRYRHPKPEVWLRYGEAGIERVRTDASGAVTLRFDAQVTASTYRSSHARYWYAPAASAEREFQPRTPARSVKSLPQEIFKKLTAVNDS